MNTHTEISTENELKVDSDVCNEAKDNVIKDDINTLDTETSGPEADKLEHVKVDEVESKPEDIESNGFESNLLEENKECSDIKHESNQEEFKEESVNLIAEAENDCLGEKSSITKTTGDQNVAVTELPIENETTEKVSEIDLQTGIQENEQAREIETTKIHEDVNQ